MATDCLALFLNSKGIESSVYDLTHFNYFFRTEIKKAIMFAVKETVTRADENSIIDIELDVGDKCYCVGIVTQTSWAMIITTEKSPHNHLIILARKLIQEGVLAQSIEENFILIKGDLLIKDINVTLEETKMKLYDNIDKLLEREEKLDDIVRRTNELSNVSKLYWENTKDLNKCCVIL
jgi:synaptobrevin family protein YKT6